MLIVSLLVKLKLHQLSFGAWFLALMLLLLLLLLLLLILKLLLLIVECCKFVWYSIIIDLVVAGEVLLWLNVVVLGCVLRGHGTHLAHVERSSLVTRGWLPLPGNISH